MDSLRFKRQQARPQLGFIAQITGSSSRAPKVCIADLHADLHGSALSRQRRDVRYSVDKLTSVMRHANEQSELVTGVGMSTSPIAHRNRQHFDLRC